MVGRDRKGSQGPGPGRALQTISGLWSFAFKSNWESPKCFFFCLVWFLFLLIVTKFHLPFGKVILALVAGTNQRESVACRKHYLLFLLGYFITIYFLFPTGFLSFTCLYAC